jgi:hypothetical protein
MLVLIVVTIITAVNITLKSDLDWLASLIVLIIAVGIVLVLITFEVQIEKATNYSEIYVKDISSIGNKELHSKFIQVKEMNDLDEFDIICWNTDNTNFFTYCYSAIKCDIVNDSSLVDNTEIIEVKGSDLLNISVYDEPLNRCIIFDDYILTDVDNNLTIDVDENETYLLKYSKRQDNNSLKIIMDWSVTE